MKRGFDLIHNDVIDDSRFVGICLIMIITSVFLILFYLKTRRVNRSRNRSISRGNLILPWYMVAINGALLISAINTLNYLAEKKVILSWSSELLNRFVLLRPDVAIFFLAPLNIIFSVFLFLRLFRKKRVLELINQLEQYNGRPNSS